MAMVTLLKISNNDRMEFAVSIGRGYYRRYMYLHQMYKAEERKKFPELDGWYKEFLRQCNCTITTVHEMVGKVVNVK